MNFRQLQDAVISKSFDETDRANVMTWINARLAMLWDHADWSFAEKTANVTVTANSNIVTNLPADFLVARGLQRADSTPLVPIYEMQDYQQMYAGTSSATVGLPQAYIANGPTQILVGPTSSETSSAYVLTYQAGPTPLVNDLDVPGFPVGYHLALVFGGKAEGYVLSSILLADPFEARWAEYLQAMESKYVQSMDAPGRQAPAYRGGNF